MIEFDNGGRLVQSLSELPDLAGAKDVYADFETSSGNPKLSSLNPWHHCAVAGLAITVDDVKGSWYVPVGHEFGGNVDEDPVIEWWCNIIDKAERWINHNVKYDAHVSANAWGVLAECSLVCTLTLAKIIDSDRIVRGGYSLEALSDGWLHEDINKYKDSLKPYLDKNKDFGRIPFDVVGEYACQDVLTGRRLFKYEDARCPDQCRRVWDEEIALTPVLFEMERNGIGVSPQDLQIKELKLMNEMLKIDEELTEITGRSFRPHVNEDCFDVLCNQYGLPVLGWTNEDKPDKQSNPSFDKKALAQYRAHPYAPQEVVKRIQRYRKINTLNNFFVKPYQDLQIDGVLHPSYNQAVRTGRLSSKEPNAQQLSPEAKELVHPRKGNSFLSLDYSQIEFRLIVHYIKDADAIKAYNEDPDTDFHSWVALMCEIARSPAKNVNFCMGYGGGKKKLITMLAQNMELVGALKTHVDKLVTDGKIDEGQQMSVFNLLCQRRAEKVYNKYHATLPSLKTTSWRAANACKSKGYVFNLYGRHRHLPEKASHRAFNSLNQSSAADLMKERTVAVAKMCKGTPIMLVSSVHDETLFEGPSEIIEDPRTIRDLVLCLEDPQVELRIPIRVSAGLSRETWKQASKEAIVLDRDWGQQGHLAHLR
jgi:DNA polymerase-1